ncbi:MAG: lipoate--protein ligase [Bacteroidales bacterium]|nr:lipoate--protein ligase [Bacteroidales bacterium]
MKYLTNCSTDPYFNLAFDEYCLENVKSGQPYFFLWRNRPSVIVGLNQNVYSEVNLEYLDAHGITLARRVTGGGAVYHDLQNLNYTIIGAHPSPEPFVEALRKLGVDAQLTGRNDIFVDGRKCSGYARRVSHGQEIIHGTLMYDVDLDTLSHVLDTPFSKMNAKGIASVKSRVCNLKDHLPAMASLDELQAALQDILSGGDQPLPPDIVPLDEVQALSDSKFSTWDFVYGRSKEAGFTRSVKLSCGTVSADFKVEGGVLTHLVFWGDFLFDEPASGLAEKLVGHRFTPSEISEALARAGVSRYLRGVSAPDLLELFF